ncbi:MAG: PhnD/SsuA/transferrin family substrate-binding protein, partial [Tabrizicola sp.]|nr:PhnD/SsuA/transferrin family substrate-binding protein [Tabrizicola sp.]
MGLRLGRVLATGGHRLSARAVAEGRADLAGIDAVTWSLMQRSDPVVDRLKTVGATAPVPGLPLIAGQGADADRLRRVLRAAIAALSTADRDALSIKGLVTLPLAAYLALPIPPSPARIAQLA